MSAVLAEDTVIRLMPGYRLQWEQAQNAYVLLYPEGMVKLNDSASEILKYCDGTRTVSQIIADLEARFPDVALGDEVRRFLETAYDQGWVKPA